MKKEQTQKIVLVALLVVGLVYSYYSYLLLPEWTHIQELKQSVQERKDHYKQLLILKSHQDELQKQIQIMEQQAQKESLLVPDHIDKPGLALNLYTLAKKHAISAQSLNYGPIQNKGNYQVIELTFTGVGLQDDIFALLNDLLNGTQVYAIQGVNLTSQKGLMQCVIKLTAYATTANSGSGRLKLSDFNLPQLNSSVLQAKGPGNGILQWFFDRIITFFD